MCGREAVSIRGTALFGESAAIIRPGYESIFTWRRRKHPLSLSLPGRHRFRIIDRVRAHTPAHTHAHTFCSDENK